MNNDLDHLDKQILDIIQSEFPIVSRPYAEIGKYLHLTETETLSRVEAMQKKGVIRRIGANFQSRKVGWKSTLCAASVPLRELDYFISIVNNYPGVTHNYLRKHQFNVWFTYIASTWEQIVKDLEDIKRKTGIEILNLPATKVFKIQVDFRMQNDDEQE